MIKLFKIVLLFGITSVAFAEDKLPQIPLPDIYIMKNKVFSLIDENPAIDCLKKSTTVIQSPLIMSVQMKNCVQNQVKEIELKPLMNQIKSSTKNISTTVSNKSVSIIFCFNKFTNLESLYYCLF